MISASRRQHGVTFAGALALGRLEALCRHLLHIPPEGFDQIIQDVCLQDLPVVFAVDRSGIVGQDGATHHGSFDISYLRNIPNMVIMSPKDENELRQMLFSAYCYEKTVAVRYPRGEALGVAIGDGASPRYRSGRWEFLKEGGDIALIGCGPVVEPASTQPWSLKRGRHQLRGGQREVHETHGQARCSSRSPATTGRILTVEENTAIGGFGSGVMEALLEEGIRVPVRRWACPTGSCPTRRRRPCGRKPGLDKDGIKKTVKHWLRVRIDTLLARKGLAESREKAKILVMAGEVYVEGERVLQAGQGGRRGGGPSR